MNDFWKIFLIKSASFAIILLLFIFGSELIKNTNELPSLYGQGMIFVGLTLSIIFFADWRKREDYEHLIKQLNSVINNLRSQLTELKKTNSVFQQKARDSMTTMNEKFNHHKNEYIPDYEKISQDTHDTQEF